MSETDSQDPKAGWYCEPHTSKRHAVGQCRHAGKRRDRYQIQRGGVDADSSLQVISTRFASALRSDRR